MMEKALDHALAARKLSAALGKKIDPADVADTFEGGEVDLVNGEIWILTAGNGAVGDAGRAYFRNGTRLAGYDEFHRLK